MSGPARQFETLCQHRTENTVLPGEELAEDGGAEEEDCFPELGHRPGL